MSTAFRNHVAAVCSALPGTEVSDPWGGGHDAWKVGGRMFALIGAVAEGVAVKCADVETAEMLKEVAAAGNARYLHKSWVQLREDTEPGELERRLVASYDLIRAKLPASVRGDLAPRAGE